MSYNLLKGKRGIIFGALNEMSIAWKVAEKAVEEGATITLSNTPMAVRMGEVNTLGEKLNAEIIPADATSVEDLENVLRETLREATPEEDFLTDKIYRYCRETGDFLMYKGTVFIDLNKLKSDSEENG